MDTTARHSRRKRPKTKKETEDEQRNEEFGLDEEPVEDDELDGSPNPFGEIKERANTAPEKLEQDKEDG